MDDTSNANGRSEVDVENTPEAIEAIQKNWDNSHGSTSLSNDTKSDKSSSDKSSEKNNSNSTSSTDIQSKIDSLEPDTVNTDTTETVPENTANNEGAASDENFLSRFWDAMTGNKEKSTNKKEDIDVENTKEAQKSMQKAVNKAKDEDTYNKLSKDKNSPFYEFDKVKPIVDKVKSFENDISEKVNKQNEEKNNQSTINAQKLAFSNIGSTNDTKVPVINTKEVDITDALPKSSPNNENKSTVKSTDTDTDYSKASPEEKKIIDNATSEYKKALDNYNTIKNQNSHINSHIKETVNNFRDSEAYTQLIDNMKTMNDNDAVVNVIKSIPEDSDIPGSPVSINKDYSVAKAALMELAAEKHVQDAKSTMDKVNKEYESSINKVPTTIDASQAELQNTINSFTGDDKVAVQNAYNTMVDQVNEIKNSSITNTEKASRLANILSDSKKALLPYANGKYTNFDTAVNKYVRDVSGTYFIMSQTEKDGIEADNNLKNPNFISRVKTAFTNNDLTTKEKIAYTLLGGTGFGAPKQSEEQNGVMQLRDIYLDSAYRSGSMNENDEKFNGAVLSSISAQGVDNTGLKNTEAGKVMKDTAIGMTSFLVAGSAAATGGITGIIELGAVVFYNMFYGGKRVLNEMGDRSRIQNNNERLANIDSNGNVTQEASPVSIPEHISGNVTRGTGADYANLSSGLTNTIIGFASGNATIMTAGIADLLKINSLSKEVNKFVGDTNIGKKGMDTVIAMNNSDNYTKDTLKENKDDGKENIDIVESTGKENTGDYGKLNQPGIDDETMKWLIRSNPSIYSKIV